MLSGRVSWSWGRGEGFLSGPGGGVQGLHFWLGLGGLGV